MQNTLILTLTLSLEAILILRTYYSLTTKKEPESETNASIDLYKVHRNILLSLDESAKINSDLQRYRQRAQWYDRDNLIQLIQIEEKKEIKQREGAAVRHLAKWLVD